MNDLGDCRVLASYALFRKLYDNGYHDIYGIIAEFINDVIISNGKHEFSLVEITKLVNDTFGFNIPHNVIKNAIKYCDNVIRKDGSYLTSGVIKRTELFQISHIETNKENSQIIASLYTYIEGIIKRKLSSDDKTKILNSFCSFLIKDSNSHEYSEYISAFIISNQDVPSFNSQLNLIREGVVLYTGINYNNRLTEVGTWNNEIKIFLEMEVLFHIAGYNGDLFQSLANELLDLISEVKSNKKIKLVKLRFFNETKNDIDEFFNKAEDIIQKGSIISPANTAMCTILDGCKEISDVSIKRSDFYRYLNNLGIIQDKQSNYYSKNLDIYNLEDAVTIDTFTEGIDSTETFEHLRLISNINKLRKGQVKGDFEDAGFILLTDTSNTLSMSKKLSKANETVPYAISINELTNLFWNRLNRGFGAKNFPKSISAITKAQIILSKHLNDSVWHKYVEVKNELLMNKTTEEVFNARLLDLRKQAKKPEEINKADLEENIISIREDTLIKFKENQELFKARAKANAEINESLRKDLEGKNLQFHILEKEIETIKELSILKDKKYALKDSLQNEKIIENDLLSLLENANKKIKSKIRIYSLSISFIYILYYSIIIYFIVSFGWSTMEPFTYILSLIPLIVSFLLAIVFGKTISPVKIFGLISDKCKKNIYSLYPNLLIDLEACQLKMIELQEELDIIEQKI